MALIRCPDCGREISDRAPACIHCGRPMEREQRSQPDYTLVLYKADYNDPNMVRLIQEITDLSEEEAALLRGTAPVVLKRGLDFETCAALTRQFSKQAELLVIHDADADNLATAVPIPIPVLTPQPPNPFLLWAKMGAIALVVMAAVSVIVVFAVLPWFI